MIISLLSGSHVMGVWLLHLLFCRLTSKKNITTHNSAPNSMHEAICHVQISSMRTWKCMAMHCVHRRRYRERAPRPLEPSRRVRATRPRPEPRATLFVSAWICSPLPRKPGVCSSAQAPSRQVDPSDFFAPHSILAILLHLHLYWLQNPSRFLLKCAVHDWDLWSLLGQR